MALAEIEFELPAEQYQRMGYPGLQQGESLTVTLDAGILLPDPASESWYAVQKEHLPSIFKCVAPATYVFAGQIQQAELFKDGGEETAILLVDCGVVALRVTCAAHEDGRLPEGTWETRYLTGIGRLQAIVEDDFATAIGKTVDVIVWSFRRLVLTPGDPVIGEWRTTEVLPATPYHYDRVVLTCRLHRANL